MGSPGYIVDNLITSTATLSASTEDSVYVLENLFDRVLANPFRWTSVAGGYVEIDFGSAQSFNSVCILGHNFDSTATISITAGASANPATVIGTPAWREDGIYAAVGAQSARYVRITVSDSNTEVSEIGELVIATAVELSKPRRIGNNSPALKRSKISHETYRGVLWNFSLFRRHTRDYSFRVLTSELASFETLDEAVNGDSTPFTFLPDVEGLEVLYVRKEIDFEPQELDARPAGGELLYDYKMVLTEESAGEYVTE